MKVTVLVTIFLLIATMVYARNKNSENLFEPKPCWNCRCCCGGGQ